MVKNAEWGWELMRWNTCLHDCEYGNEKKRTAEWHHRVGEDRKKGSIDREESFPMEGLQRKEDERDLEKNILSELLKSPSFIEGCTFDIKSKLVYKLFFLSKICWSYRWKFFNMSSFSHGFFAIFKFRFSNHYTLTQSNFLGLQNESSQTKFIFTIFIYLILFKNQKILSWKESVLIASKHLFFPTIVQLASFSLDIATRAVPIYGSSLKRFQLCQQLFQWWVRIRGKIS